MQLKEWIGAGIGAVAVGVVGYLFGHAQQGTGAQAAAPAAAPTLWAVQQGHRYQVTLTTASPPLYPPNTPPAQMTGNGITADPSTLQGFLQTQLNTLAPSEYTVVGASLTTASNAATLIYTIDVVGPSHNESSTVLQAGIVSSGSVTVTVHDVGVTPTHQ